MRAQCFFFLPVSAITGCPLARIVTEKSGSVPPALEGSTLLYEEFVATNLCLIYVN